MYQNRCQQNQIVCLALWLCPNQFSDWTIYASGAIQVFQNRKNMWTTMKLMVLVIIDCQYKKKKIKKYLRLLLKVLITLGFLTLKMWFVICSNLGQIFQKKDAGGQYKTVFKKAPQFSNSYSAQGSNLVSCSQRSICQNNQILQLIYSNKFHSKILAFFKFVNTCSSWSNTHSWRATSTQSICN
jgi:hypothetical protein